MISMLGWQFNNRTAEIFTDRSSRLSDCILNSTYAALCRIRLSTSLDLADSLDPEPWARGHNDGINSIRKLRILALRNLQVLYGVFV